MTRHFDEAGRNAIRVAERYAAERGTDVIVVRDLLGRNSVVVAVADKGAKGLPQRVR